jgi:hypothetical protein
LGIGTDKDLLLFLALRRLAILRHCSAILIYENNLFKSENVSQMSENFLYTLYSVMLCEYSKNEFLSEAMPFLCSISSFKASLAEAKFRWYLREHFDDQWWREKRASKYFRDIWREGGRVNCDNISKQIDGKELDITHLLNYFEDILGRY